MAKNLLEQFIDYLNEQVENHSIYIWGGQGQKYPTLTEEWIKKKETGTNRNRALNTYNKAVELGYKEVCRAFDCSGLITYWLYNVKKLINGDMTANGLKAKCKKIPVSNLSKGCFVFRVDGNRAYHVGVVVDDDLNVIHAKGRAYGVIKEKFNSKYWNYYGIPTWFEKWIIEKTTYTFKRNLKQGCIGEDVKNLQEMLVNATGIEIDCDSVYGAITRATVITYQFDKNLKIDGIAGKETITSLGGIFE